MAEKDDRLFDVRVVERNLRKGLLTKQDVEDHLRGLEDVADNAEPTEIPQPAIAAELQEQQEQQQQEQQAENAPANQTN